MSYYYNYYLGYKNREDGKIYPLGPYDADGRLRPAYSTSRSYSSDLHETFWQISTDMISDELRKEFPHDLDFDNSFSVPLEYAPLDGFPRGDGIRRGYFLISDIDLYEKNNGDFDKDCLFYEWLTPTAYCEKLKAETSGIPPIRKKDVEGNEFEQHSASEYGYYAYLDRFSAEYEVSRIRAVASVFEYSKCLNYGANEIVILKTEG